MNNGSMDAHMIYCENWDFKTDYDLEVVEPRDMKGYVAWQNGAYYLVARDRFLD